MCMSHSWQSHPILSHSKWRTYEVYVDTLPIDTSRALNLLEGLTELPQHVVDSLTPIIKRNSEMGMWQLLFSEDSFKLIITGDSVMGSFVAVQDTLYLSPSSQSLDILKLHIVHLSQNCMVLRQPISPSDTGHHYLELRFYPFN